jgi:polygalacturonase/galacturan 1,4-alpha-galacturonidase
VTQTSGAYLDGQGALYWDGLGSDGGVTKPKFFAAHSLISSTISDIYIYNAPVQVFSIDTCTDLTMTGITVNNIDGNDLLSSGVVAGANTDGFDIGDSAGVTITGANVYN